MPTDDALARAAHPGTSVTGAPAVRSDMAAIPDYLSDTYHWAYLSPLGRAIFDHPLVVHGILWGNYHRLIRAALQEVSPGTRVLQTACVYGHFSVRLAERVGPEGQLDVVDVAPIQVEHCRRKLARFAHADVRVADASRLGDRGPYDTIVCFFLLHEVPDEYKSAIVDGILARLGPKGRAVFVDYHSPVRVHPLRPVMKVVFDLLEPFAERLWGRDIASYASRTAGFTLRKETFFGGLYQKVVFDRND